MGLVNADSTGRGSAFPGDDLLDRTLGSISLSGQNPGSDLWNARIAGSSGPSALPIPAIDRAKTARRLMDIDKGRVSAMIGELCIGLGRVRTSN